MESLPNEILRQIFTHTDVLEYTDLLSLSQVSRRLNQLLSAVPDPAIWKCMFRKVYPALFNDVNDPDFSVDWRKRFRDRYDCELSCHEIVSSCSSKFWFCQDLSDSDISSVLGEMLSKFDLEIVSDALHAVYLKKNLKEELTLEYYSLKLHRFVLRSYLTKKLRCLLSDHQQPHPTDVFERGLTLIARWFQPLKSISYRDIDHRLTKIAADCRQHLKHVLPDHTLVKEGGPGKVVLDKTEVLQLVSAISHVLFSVYKLEGNKADYYDVNNSFLDSVLLDRHLGIPILLCLVFHSVSRRMGFKGILLANLPGHFMLKWEAEVPTESVFIDCFSQGRILSCQDTFEMVNRTWGAAGQPGENFVEAVLKCTPTVVQVLNRVAGNISRNLMSAATQATSRMDDVREGFELTDVLNSCDQGCLEPIDSSYTLSQVYLRMRINCDKVVKIAERLEGEGNGEPDITEIKTVAMIRQTEVEAARLKMSQTQHTPKLRSRMEAEHPDHKFGRFAVGMVMRHIRYNYDCVIYGWDELCKADAAWIQQMGVDKLPFADKQPFYNVLVSDGSVRYAAEVSLQPAEKGTRVTHDQLGRFFEKYNEDGRTYQPNSELARIYPEEKATLDAFFQELDSVNDLRMSHGLE